jgi:hypothetical protein
MMEAFHYFPDSGLSFRWCAPSSLGNLRVILLAPS